MYVMNAYHTGWIYIFIFFVTVSGCAVTGPGPKDSGFSLAARTLPAAKTAVYTISSTWYPNTMLGSVDSFHASSTPGRLFVSPERLTFAVFDDATNSFLLAYEVARSDVRWLTIKDHGLARIIRLQSGGSVNSFLFGDGETIDGKFFGKDEVAKYLLSLYPYE